MSPNFPKCLLWPFPSPLPPQEPVKFDAFHLLMSLLSFKNKTIPPALDSCFLKIV